MLRSTVLDHASAPPLWHGLRGLWSGVVEVEIVLTVIGVAPALEEVVLE